MELMLGTNISGTDSDSDGLPDYYESNIPIYNGGYMMTNTALRDTDGDSLADGEEILITREYSSSYNNVKVTAVMRSDPRNEDSDDDRVEDSVDARPLKNDIVELNLTHPYTSVEYDGFSYGGNQAWFSKNGNTEYLISRNGCALIGITDIILYLLRNNQCFRNNYLLGELCDENDFNNDGTIKMSSYIRIVNSLENSYFSVRYAGLSTYTLPISLNRLASDYNWTIKGICPDDSDVCLESLIYLISQDIPVLLFLSGSANNGNTDYSNTAYYNIHDNVLSYYKPEQIQGSVVSTGHAVVVTGIVSDGDEFWLKVSNHGQELYINYQQLIDYIVYIRNPYTFFPVKSTTILRIHCI